MDDLDLDKKIKWYQWVPFYFFWGITVVLWFVIFFMARTAFRMLLFDFASKEWISWAMAHLAEKVLVVIIGVVVLGFIVFVQDYFYKAFGKGFLLQRFLHILGIQILTIFVFNTIIVIPKCLSPEGINLLLLIGFELVAGLVLMVYPFRSREGKAP